MKHLLIVTYSGDMQGTTLEKKLKDYVYREYRDSICSEDATKSIFEDIQEECNRLAEAHPKCKKPVIEFKEPFYSGDGYAIRMASIDPNKNTGLLRMKLATTTYITPYETMNTAVDDITEI